uniref:Uncharacterized protein n=1 Tax=Panagrolaimus superbus TaxID=310955 RepID=A0A914XWG9_9BILA
MAHKVPLAPSESSTSLSNNLSVLGIQDSSTVDSSELNSSKTEIKQEGLLKEEVVSSPGYLSKPQGVKRRLCKDPIGGSVKKVEKDLADMEEIIRGNKKPKNICLCFKGPASLRKVTTSRGSVLNLTLLDKFGRSVEAVVWPPESTIIEQKLQAFEEDIALEASNDLWVSFPKQPFVFADILHKLNFGPKVIFRCYQLPAGYAASFTKSTPLDLFDLRKKILYHTYKFKIDSMDILEVLSHPKPLSDDLNAVVVGNTDSLAFMKFPKSIEASSMIKFGGNITLKGVHISYDANEIDVDKYWNLFYEESSETKPSHILIISATRSSSIFETDEAATYFVESVSELKHVTPLFLNETFT